jgi:hypothetical protein
MVEQLAEGQSLQAAGQLHILQALVEVGAEGQALQALVVMHVSPQLKK